MRIPNLYLDLKIFFSLNQEIINLFLKSFSHFQTSLNTSNLKLTFLYRTIVTLCNQQHRSRKKNFSPHLICEK